MPLIPIFDRAPGRGLYGRADDALAREAELALKWAAPEAAHRFLVRGR
jgi:hypothetical protein